MVDCGVDLERFRPLERRAPPPVRLRRLADRAEERRPARERFRPAGEGTLTFVGDGPLRPQLEGRPGVSVTGYLPHDAVPLHLAAADVLCQPSLVEPFGQAALEALASGRPVVATRTAGRPSSSRPAPACSSTRSTRTRSRRPAAAALPAEPRRAGGGRAARPQAAGAGWRRFSSEPFEIGEPDLDERPHGLLDPRLASQLERLLVALARLLRRDSLLQPVVPVTSRRWIFARTSSPGGVMAVAQRGTRPLVLMSPRVRVLIVDDHLLFAEALEAVLATEERIEVVGRAADGQEAVALARRLQPDVVALDISMPVMDGFEAAAELERFDHPPAVLMLTGSNAPEDVDRARRGARGYITKDTIAASLVDAILAAAR